MCNLGMMYEYGQGVEKNLEEANHIIELIEHLSESERHSIADSQKEFRDLQKRFSDLGSMPKDRYEEIHKRYKAVCEQFSEGIQVAKASARKELKLNCTSCRRPS